MDAAEAHRVVREVDALAEHELTSESYFHECYLKRVHQYEDCPLAADELSFNCSIRRLDAKQIAFPHAEAIGKAGFIAFECRKYGTLQVTNSSTESIVGDVSMSVVTPTLNVTIRKEATGSSFTVPVLCTGTMSELMPVLGIMAVLPGETTRPLYNARMQEDMDMPQGRVTDYVFPIVIRVAPTDDNYIDVADVEDRWPYPVAEIVKLPMKNALTTDQAKQLHAKAAKLGIEIVTEIDLPGHSWLSTLAEPCRQWHSQGLLIRGGHCGSPPCFFAGNHTGQKAFLPVANYQGYTCQECGRAGVLLRPRSNKCRVIICWHCFGSRQAPCPCPNCIRCQLLYETPALEALLAHYRAGDHGLIRAVPRRAWSYMSSCHALRAVTSSPAEASASVSTPFQCPPTCAAAPVSGPGTP